MKVLKDESGQESSAAAFRWHVISMLTVFHMEHCQYE
jgi:hypothetical protein